MLNPEEPPSTIMDAVESGMSMSEAVWVNLMQGADRLEGDYLIVLRHQLELTRVKILTN
jgi:hypothetical protein